MYSIYSKDSIFVILYLIQCNKNDNNNNDNDNNNDINNGCVFWVFYV